MNSIQWVQIIGVLAWMILSDRTRVVTKQGPSARMDCTPLENMMMPRTLTNIEKYRGEQNFFME